MKPDIILKNAHIFTALKKEADHSALAIKGDKIIFTGQDHELSNLSKNDCIIIDLDGKTVLPGFCDSHAHGVMGGRLINHCLLSSGMNLTDYLDIIQRYANEHKNHDHIMGFGWAHAPFGPKGPDKKELDHIFPDKPAAFLSIDYHSCWVNSAALSLAGINRNTANPEGGVIERYEGSSEPSGCLRESAAINKVLNQMPEPSDEDWQSAIKTYQKKAAENGITALFDAGILNHSQSRAFDAISKLDHQGKIKMRIAQSYVLDPDLGADQIDTMETLFQKHKGNKNYQLRLAKIFMDGAIEGHTGFLLKPYADRKGFYSRPVWRQEVFNKTVTELDKRGIQVHVHSIGDGAVKAALDGFEEAFRINGRRDARHTLAHIELAKAADVKRFADMGVFASFQPAWFYMDSNYFEETIPLLAAERSDRRYMLKNFVDAGAFVAFGSDWPWGNINSNMNPLDGIGTAVTRENPDENMLKAYEADQRIDLPTALRNYTINGALQNFNEHISGTLEIGKKADIAVLNQDIFTVHPDELYKVKVQMTFFDGRLVYQKN